jgi:uncharacterized protein YjlB
MKNCNARFEADGNIHKYYLPDHGAFPNSELPVILYKQIIKWPFFLRAIAAKKLLKKNGWGNNWTGGIDTFHHYHSTTHEVLAVISGKTMVLLGGENGTIITLKEGDIIVIPAGVAHKNLGKENGITCVGGYPDGKDFDMQYGTTGERPGTDINISRVPVPKSGPFCGEEDPLMKIWRAVQERHAEHMVQAPLSV